MNFRAPKVVKWATVLPMAANPVSVDPSKYGTKRKGSEEVCFNVNKSFEKMPGKIQNNNAKSITFWFLNVFNFSGILLENLLTLKTYDARIDSLAQAKNHNAKYSTDILSSTPSISSLFSRGG